MYSRPYCRVNKSGYIFDTLVVSISLLQILRSTKKTTIRQRLQKVVYIHTFWNLGRIVIFILDRESFLNALFILYVGAKYAMFSKMFLLCTGKKKIQAELEDANIDLEAQRAKVLELEKKQKSFDKVRQSCVQNMAISS